MNILLPNIPNKRESSCFLQTSGREEICIFLPKFVHIQLFDQFFLEYTGPYSKLIHISQQIKYHTINGSQWPSKKKKKAVGYSEQELSQLCLYLGWLRAFSPQKSARKRGRAQEIAGPGPLSRICSPAQIWGWKRVNYRVSSEKLFTIWPFKNKSSSCMHSSSAQPQAFEGIHQLPYELLSLSQWLAWWWEHDHRWLPIKEQTRLKK